MHFEQVCSSEKASLCSIADVGGKASNLAWLSARGFNVPRWFVVRTAAFRQQLERSGIAPDIDALCREFDATGSIDEAKLAELRERFLQCEIFPALTAEIAAALAEHGAVNSPPTISPPTMQHWSVRSSVSHEDGQANSFAGQFETYLFRADLNEICAALKQVWASAFRQGALDYALRKGIAVVDLKVAVIVQQMIDADKAGVTFTANPVTGNTAQMLISATYGVGEGVVSGACDTDEFVLGSSGELIEKKIAYKRQCCAQVGTAAKGIDLVDVDLAEREKSSLTDVELATLWTVCQSVAQQKDIPQDIEWCFRNGQLYLLQTRPITAKTL